MPNETGAKAVLPWLVAYQSDDGPVASVTVASDSADALASVAQEDPVLRAGGVLAWVVVPISAVEVALAEVPVLLDQAQLPVTDSGVVIPKWLVFSPSGYEIVSAPASKLAETMAAGTVALDINLILAAIFSWRSLREDHPILYRGVRATAPLISGRVARTPKPTVH